MRLKKRDSEVNSAEIISGMLALHAERLVRFNEVERRFNEIERFAGNETEKSLGMKEKVMLWSIRMSRKLRLAREGSGLKM